MNLGAFLSCEPVRLFGQDTRIVRGFVLQVARLLHMDEPEQLAAAYVEKMRIERGED